MSRFDGGRAATVEDHDMTTLRAIAGVPGALGTGSVSSSLQPLPVQPTSNAPPSVVNGIPADETSGTNTIFDRVTGVPAAPMVVYVNDETQAAGQDIARVMRESGLSVRVRNTQHDPAAAQGARTAWRSFYTFSAEPHFPLIDGRAHGLFPMPWVLGVDSFRSNMWSWMSTIVRHSSGSTSPSQSQPQADSQRQKAMRLLREPSGSLPPIESPFFGRLATRPLSSALDQLYSSVGNIGEGAMRAFRGAGAGVRQALAGFVQLPFTLLTFPIAALETATQYPMDRLLELARAETNPALKALLFIAFALVTLLLMPLRAVSFVAGLLFARPLSRVGQWLAERISGNDFGRLPVDSVPAQLFALDDRTAIGGIARNNVTNFTVADPETWVAFYARSANTDYMMPSPLIRELTELRIRNRDEYNALRAQLADAGIQCFYRFPSLQLLRETLDNRTRANDPRPLALVVAGVSDHNGAFLSMRSAMSTLSQTHRVVYVEAIDDTEIAAAIARYGSQRRIATLVVAGHGTQNSLQLSALPASAERDLLDVGDAPRFAPLGPFFEDDAFVSLEACSTGSEEGGRESLADMLHRIWPHTRIAAPRVPSRDAGIRLREDGRVHNAPTIEGQDRMIRPSDPIRIWNPN